MNSPTKIIERLETKTGSKMDRKHPENPLKCIIIDYCSER